MTPSKFISHFLLLLALSLLVTSQVFPSLPSTTEFQCERDSLDYTIKQLTTATAIPTTYTPTGSSTPIDVTLDLKYYAQSPRFPDVTPVRPSLRFHQSRATQGTSTRSELRFPNMKASTTLYSRLTTQLYLSESSSLGEYTIQQLHFKSSGGGSTTPPLRIAYLLSGSDDDKVKFERHIWAIWHLGGSSYSKKALFPLPSASDPTILSIYFTGNDSESGSVTKNGGVVVEWYDLTTLSVKSLRFPIDNLSTWSTRGEYYFKTGIYCSGGTNFNPGGTDLELVQMEVKIDEAGAISRPAWFVPTNDDRDTPVPPDGTDDDDDLNPEEPSGNGRVFGLNGAVVLAILIAVWGM